MICTTTVADVPKTNITFKDETYYKPSVSNDCWYQVKNGICYVNLRVTCVTPNTDVTKYISNMLPSPSGTVDAMLYSPSDDYKKIIQTDIFMNNNRLILRYGVAGTSYYGSFSYPVAES